VETGFTELANRWLPILNVFDENGVELNTKNTSADQQQTDDDQAQAAVSQMAKRATTKAQNA